MFDLGDLVKLTNGFTGAEIEQVIVDGLFLAFDEDREPTLNDYSIAAARTVPISKTMEKKIEALRGWANGRALMANESDKRKNAPTSRAAKREGRVKPTTGSDWSGLKKKAN